MREAYARYQGILFEIPIQAAVGGKIIARETLRRFARMCLPSATVVIFHEEAA